jgi:isocitrate dehydrogenase
MTSKPAYRIASIPGDGIGMEVVAAAIQVVQKLAKTLDTFQIEFTHIPWGTAYYKQNGRYVPEDSLDILRKFDAGLFGAVGAPGMYDMREVDFWNPIIISNTTDRCAGSYLPLGPPPSHPWPIAALRQCPPSADLPRN